MGLRSLPNGARQAEVRLALPLVRSGAAVIKGTRGARTTRWRWSRKSHPSRRRPATRPEFLAICACTGSPRRASARSSWAGTALSEPGASSAGWPLVACCGAKARSAADAISCDSGAGSARALLRSIVADNRPITGRYRAETEEGTSALLLRTWMTMTCSPNGAEPDQIARGAGCARAPPVGFASVYLPSDCGPWRVDWGGWCSVPPPFSTGCTDRRDDGGGQAKRRRDEPTG